MFKKKSNILLYILLLVFCLGLSSTSFALIADLSDFKEKYEQVLDFCVDRPESTNYVYKEFKNLLNSNIWNQYKNNIPFGDYSNCIVRNASITVNNSYKKRVDIFLWNADTTYYVTNLGTLKTNANINMNYAISFICDVGGTNYSLNWERFNDWQWNTDHGSFDVRFGYTNYSLIFIDSEIVNESQYDIPGKGYTYTIVQPQVPISVNISGETWLANIFIGQYIYDDIELKIRDQYGNYINSVMVTTIADYGRTGFLNFYGQDIVNGNRYFTDVYYNDTLIYTDPNGTIVNVIYNEEEEPETPTIDLTETNQKLDNIANIIESGNKVIVSTIESGNKEIVSTIESGNKEIVGALTDTSYNNDITSGDFINYELEAPTLNLFDYILQNVSNIFLNNESVNLQLTIPYLLNEPYTLNSDFFVLSGPLLLLVNFICILIFVYPKLNDLHEVIKIVNMGYSDAFINYFGHGISLNDLL